MPTLKDHLQDEWEKLQKRAKNAAVRNAKLKRRTPETMEARAVASSQSASPDDKDGSEEPTPKRVRLGKQNSRNEEGSS